MVGNQRARLTENEAIEHRIACPGCGSYTSLSAVIATGHCSRGAAGRCGVRLSLDLVVGRR